MTARPIRKDIASFYEFWNDVEDPDVEAPEGEVSASDVARVIEEGELRPPPEELENCRHYVALAIWKIRQLDPRTVRPSDVRRELNGIEAAARKVRDKIKALPDDVLTELRASAFLRDCGRIIVKSAAMADKMTTVKGSGGAQLGWARKMVAARYADFLMMYPDIIPSRSKDGDYVRLAELLFDVATGKQGSCVKACAQHFCELEEDGRIDAARLKEWRLRVGFSTTKK